MSELNLWENDKLGRAAEGAFLVNYLNALYADNNEDIYHESFVLNLNSPWGQGKTYFLKNIEMLVDSKNHPVLYFDAWSNDYSKSPLIGFLSELQHSLLPYTAKTPKLRAINKAFIKNGKKLLGSLAGIGTQILVKQLTGSSLERIKADIGLEDSEISDIAEDVSKSASATVDEIVKKSLEEHQETKDLIIAFKKSLNDITQSLKDTAGYSLPMYVLVDELDRCRPTYAIELLESIKHIFSSSGVFFIVATHKEELSHSIKAVYGAEFDSFNYLKRFFNQEYTLSIPDTSEFSKFLFQKYRISIDRFVIPFDANKNSTDNMALMLFEQFTTSFKLSLRDKEQICMQLKSILLTSKDDKLQYIYLLVLLVFNHIHGENVFPNVQLYIKGSYKEIKPFTLNLTRRTSDGWTNAECSIFDVVRFFFTHKDSTMNEISRLSSEGKDPWQEAILEALYSRNQNGTSVTPLSKYLLLVQQAGHLS